MTEHGKLFESRELMAGWKQPLLQSCFSLSLAAGERAVLVGPSGGGKTTLLRTLAGLMDPIEGEIRLEGRTPDEWGWPQFRRRVLYLHQQPVLTDDTVEANLRMPFHYRSSQKDFSRERAAALLRRLNLDETVLRANAHELSVGQRQRVCLVRALLVEPKVLLLDEPTSSLDQESVGLVEELLREISSSEGIALIVVTHDHSQAGRLGGRTIEVLPAPPGAEVRR